MRAMEGEDSIAAALDDFFSEIVTYATADRSHLGCLLGSVAPVTDAPDVRRFLKANLAVTEAQIADRLSTAAGAASCPLTTPSSKVPVEP